MTIPRDKIEAALAKMRIALEMTETRPIVDRAAALAYSILIDDCVARIEEGRSSVAPDTIERAWAIVGPMLEAVDAAVKAKRSRS